MPCNQIRTTTVELGNKEPVLLKQAFESLGFSVNQFPGGLLFSGYHEGRFYSGSYSNGNIQFEGNVMEVNVIKVAYSHAVVKKASKTYGWSLKKKTGNKYTATKH